MIENDPFEWNYKTIWFGRFKKKYKMHPENLQEEKCEVKVAFPRRFKINVGYTE